MKLILILQVSITIVGLATPAQSQTNSPAELQRLADEYYKWRNQQYPALAVFERQ